MSHFSSVDPPNSHLKQQYNIHSGALGKPRSFSGQLMPKNIAMPPGSRLLKRISPAGLSTVPSEMVEESASNMIEVFDGEKAEEHLMEF
jgi:hypothetical protein